MTLLLHDIEAFLCSLKGVTYIVKVTTLLAAATALQQRTGSVSRHYDTTYYTRRCDLVVVPLITYLH